ncbi:MAG: hypothetical protein ABIH27_07415 [Candidatus Omnitrophota bacterium]
MNCKKVQELLKADYFDGLTGQRDQKLVKGHLDNCGKCRKLEEELLLQRAFFQKLKLAKAPESLWQDIRQAIVGEQLVREEESNRGALSRLKELLLGHRPAFALASVFTLILCVAVFSGIFMQKRQSVIPENSGESILEYSLESGNNDLVYNLGTNVERYFF